LLLEGETSFEIVTPHLLTTTSKIDRVFSSIVQAFSPIITAAFVIPIDHAMRAIINSSLISLSYFWEVLAHFGVTTRRPDQLEYFVHVTESFAIARTGHTVITARAVLITE
jgi:hypothetical protein